MKNINFLPNQYKKNKKFKINHNYLSQQFSDYKKIFSKIEKIVKNNDFTLGSQVDELEKKFVKLTDTKYAIAVGSGTDAIFLSLKSLGIGEGDEVITTSFTFHATVGAIATTGAKPVFVDIDSDLNINCDLIEKKITKKTKAIVPVHWAGKICDMNKILLIAKKYNLYVIEDACHSILAHNKKRKSGSFGDTGCFSFHPLKNLNIWGDGGIIVTKNKKIADKLFLMRNHGLKSRDICVLPGYNSRLDTIQAVVALHQLQKIKNITQQRIKNSNYLNSKLKDLQGISIINNPSNSKHVYHLFQFYFKNRDKLLKFLISYGIDAKIHYPIPLHLQPAYKYLKYKKGDFVMSEYASKNIISLPVHEFIKKKELDFMINKIKYFINNES